MGKIISFPKLFRIFYLIPIGLSAGQAHAPVGTFLHISETFFSHRKQISIFKISAIVVVFITFS